MPTINPQTGVTGQLTIPASGSVDVMQGTAYEFSGPNGNTYAVAFTAAAAGLALDVDFGSVSIAEGLAGRVTATVGDLRVPDDLKVKQRAAPGQKVRVTVRNLTSGALAANVLVDIT